MLERLMNLIVRASNIQPHYTAEHCIAVKKSMGGCTVCEDVCPHDAITIGREVRIDDIDCTGCGLCVQACPSQALNSSVQYQPGAPLRCSQVKGTAQSVQCLTRLQTSDLLRLAGRGDKVTLVRSDCAACPIGSAAVPGVLDEALERAKQYATLRERTLETQVLVLEKYDTTDNPETVSRRDLLRGSWRGMQRGMSDALAPLDPGQEVDEDDERVPLPQELQRQYRFLEIADLAPEEPVPWVLPRVAEGCIMCPVCTNVCPTQAFWRDLEPASTGSGGVLRLEPERCNGCDACVRSCPVRVISLDNEVTWGEVSGGTITAFERESAGEIGNVARQGPPRLRRKSPDGTPSGNTSVDDGASNDTSSGSDEPPES
ncbi:MAG: 4Fe-4S binding protein [Trueperaceae bacterium]|nr:4Fe-4S binding protein [Trueperaceae bacterium]